ncbi:hypothetical protein AMTRI_Chr03g148890 [Amborella trichopoda]
MPPHLSLHSTTTPLFFTPPHHHLSFSLLPTIPPPPPQLKHQFRAIGPLRYSVRIEHGAQSEVLEVGEGETILERALDEGIDVPHDCKLGVCMTCPARLMSGVVDQSEGMLSEDVVAEGYALLCVSYPKSDCHIKTIPEEELLSLQLATAND